MAREDIIMPIGNLLQGLASGVTDFTRGLAGASQGLPAAVARGEQARIQQDLFKQNMELRQSQQELRERQNDELNEHRMRQLQLKNLQRQTDMWVKALPEAIENSPHMVPQIQAEMAKIDQQANELLAAPPPPPAYEGRTPDLEGIAPVPPPSGSPAPEPPIDLSDMSVAHSRKKFEEALDEAVDWYDDSGNIDKAMERALITHPAMTEEEQAEMRVLVEGSIEDIPQETIDSMARIAAENYVMLNSMRSSTRDRVVMSMAEQDLLPTKGMPVAVIKDLTQFDTALYELSLLAGLPERHPELFGPFAGWFFPKLWGMDIREDSKKIIARYDDVRQLVGKAKEGGVLRKEDEIKYLKIVGSIIDEPGVALFKIRSILKSMKYTRDRYLGYVKQAGMYVDINELQPIWPVDIRTASFEELALYHEEWPELKTIMANRFPDLYEKYVERNE
jgi:hypothetical protein